MLSLPFSFDQILAPLGAARFLAEYHDQKPLHLEGAGDKFAAVMTWAKLNQLLGQATIWSHQSLLLVLDKEALPAGRYCAPAIGRDGGQVLRPDPKKVRTLLAEGATLVANDIDHLSAGLTAFADAMEQALGARIQGNLYLSSKRRKGFDSHFDSHDVYAVQVEGTKTWTIYEGRAEAPINHPLFKSLPQQHHDRAKGKVMMAVPMTPGDLLYLPRGWYHDALADDGGAVHIAFGATVPIGLDVVSLLFERMIGEALFRQHLPRPDEDGGRTLAARLSELGASIARVLDDPDTLTQVQTLQRGFRYPRNSYDLPKLLDPATAERFRVRAKGIRLVEQGGRYGLVEEGGRQATEVPAAVSALVGWVLEQDEFTRAELARAFPERPSAQVDELLVSLGAMRLAVPA